MPNLLAHFGAQGFVTSVLYRNAASKWILLGCLIPDIPWIAQRAVRAIVPSVDPYELRLYAIVQASLVFCVVLSGAIAVLSKDPRSRFAILALGAVLHLLLDALETKWANGVHFAAPISWKLVNFDLFWPESLPSYVLTVSGLAYFASIWSRRMRPLESPAAPTVQRMALASGLLIVYIVLPLALREGPEARDNHYVKTLREVTARVGRYVEFDRNEYLERSGRAVLRTFAGEEIVLDGVTSRSSSVVSLRGTFIDANTVSIQEIHEHSRFGRDVPSYLALALIVALWLRSFWTRASIK